MSQNSENATTPSAATLEAAPARIPLIGEPAPGFTAVTTQGTVHFPEDYKCKWVILFSHPADFTPVCTTEFMTFATLLPFLVLSWVNALFGERLKALFHLELQKPAPGI